MRGLAWMNRIRKTGIDHVRSLGRSSAGVQGEEGNDIIANHIARTMDMVNSVCTSTYLVRMGI